MKHLICKGGSVIQENHPERRVIRKLSGKNYQDKSIVIGFMFVLWIFKIKYAFLALAQGKI